jgi:hypothetical protein
VLLRWNALDRERKEKKTEKRVSVSSPFYPSFTRGEKFYSFFSKKEEEVLFRQRQKSAIILHFGN